MQLTAKAVGSFVIPELYQKTCIHLAANYLLRKRKDAKVYKFYTIIRETSNHTADITVFNTKLLRKRHYLNLL